MVGDGVNDVPALKECDVAVALGSGSQLAKGVADVVLVTESFESIPFAIEEGRKILRNVQRVAKLFVTKSVFAALLILTVGVGGGSYPVPAAPALARGRLHRRHPGLLPRARPRSAGATQAVPARRRRVRHPGGPRARRRRPARARARAHLDRPLGGRVADDVDDDPRLRRPLPRARARVGQHAPLAACAARSSPRSSAASPSAIS